MEIQNKKAIAPLIWLLIIGGTALVGVLSGYIVKSKIENTINSFPPIFWYGIIFLLILFLLPKRK